MNVCVQFGKNGYFCIIQQNAVLRLALVARAPKQFSSVIDIAMKSIILCTTSTADMSISCILNALLSIVAQWRGLVRSIGSPVRMPAITTVGNNLVKVAHSIVPSLLIYTNTVRYRAVAVVVQVNEW